MAVEIHPAGSFRRYAVTGAEPMSTAARRKFLPAAAVADFDPTGTFVKLWISGPQIRQDGTHGIRHTGIDFYAGRLGGLPDWARPLTAANVTPPPV